MIKRPADAFVELILKKPLIDKTFLLEKYPGKGGWTYVRVPKILKDKNAPFGWVKVKGTIDNYEIKQYGLMPMKDGNLFLPVKAEIRKKIGKSEGDYVHIKLYPDTSPLEVPEEMLLCLKDEPGAYHFFNSLSESEKRLYVLWIYESKCEETRVDRLVKSINRLQQGLKLYEKIN